MQQLENAQLIKILAVIVLGATGTYLLLPHKHGLTRPRLAHQVGFVMATLAVLVFTLLWEAHGVELVSKVFFYMFAFSAIAGAILTIVSRDPIHSALWFAAVVLSTSGLFLLSGAQFLAAGTIIVYAGAIIVTFLFVIMLAQKEGRAIYDRMARAPFWATFASFLLMFGLIYSLVALKPFRSINDREPMGTTADKVPTPGVLRVTAEQDLILAHALPETATLPEVPKGAGAFENHVAGLGGTLYTDHLVTVELAGALLFAALIGALAIATPRAPIRPSTSDAAAKAGA